MAATRRVICPGIAMLVARMSLPADRLRPWLPLQSERVGDGEHAALVAELRANIPHAGARRDLHVERSLDRRRHPVGRPEQHIELSLPGYFAVETDVAVPDAPVERRAGGRSGDEGPARPQCLEHGRSRQVLHLYPCGRPAEARGGGRSEDVGVAAADGDDAVAKLDQVTPPVQ